MQKVKLLVDELISTAQQVVAFDSSTLRHLAIGYLAGGHVLLEGLPGTGKTSAAKLLAKLLGRSFKRVQFTSDLLPADLLGAHIFQPKSGELHFVKGPLFTDVVFADEINRAPPRTQSALLEAMEEHQITVEGCTFPLSSDFFVVATQNPQDLEGTFPLPEAQIDRFLIKLNLTHATEISERWIVNAALEGRLPVNIENVSSLSIALADIRKEVSNVLVDQSIVEYTVRLIRATREHRMIQFGSSVRGTIGLLRSARVWAASFGREFVSPDDIKQLAPAILCHRIALTADAQLNRTSAGEVVSEILQKTPFPK